MVYISVLWLSNLIITSIMMFNLTLQSEMQASRWWDWQSQNTFVFTSYITCLSIGPRKIIYIKRQLISYSSSLYNLPNILLLLARLLSDPINRDNNKKMNGIKWILESGAHLFCYYFLRSLIRSLSSVWSMAMLVSINSLFKALSELKRCNN